jgi:hypothetical protein
VAFSFHLNFVFGRSSELLLIVCSLNLDAVIWCSGAVPFRALQPLLSHSTLTRSSPLTTVSRLHFVPHSSLFPVRYARRYFLRTSTFHSVPPLHVPVCRELAAAHKFSRLDFFWQRTLLKKKNRWN